MPPTPIRTLAALAHAEVARSGGVVERPAGPDARFGLRWVRSGPRTTGRPPVLVVPGGPGCASVLPYRGLRRRAAARGLDVIMVEHRGVGLSRKDIDGVDLPVRYVTIAAVVDDLAAALDDAGVPRAVVHGASYGSYPALAFAVRHPERVAGLVLDSPLLSVAGDLADVRSHLRRLLWDGLDPATARAAGLVRRLAAGSAVPAAQLTTVVQAGYEFGGPGLTERLLDARVRGHGRRTWDAIARIGEAESGGPGTPLFYEPDLVRGIAYGELGYGCPPDGHPLDPQWMFEPAARDAPPFGGEPYDLAAALPGLDVPIAVVSGERDLRTPRRTAERIVAPAPDAVLVPLAGTGHSALDTHRSAAVAVDEAMVRGGHRDLPARASRIAASGRRGPSGWLAPAVRAGLRADRLLPGR